MIVDVRRKAFRFDDFADKVIGIMRKIEYPGEMEIFVNSTEWSITFYYKETTVSEAQRIAYSFEPTVTSDDNVAAAIGWFFMNICG